MPRFHEKQLDDSRVEVIKRAMGQQKAPPERG
jgi:hypothetical protein